MTDNDMKCILDRLQKLEARLSELVELDRKVRKLDRDLKQAAGAEQARLQNLETMIFGDEPPPPPEKPKRPDYLRIVDH